MLKKFNLPITVLTILKVVPCQMCIYWFSNMDFQFCQPKFGALPVLQDYPTYLKVCRTVVTLKNVCNHFVTYTHRASQKEVRAGPYYYISCDGPTGRPVKTFYHGKSGYSIGGWILWFGFWNPTLIAWTYMDQILQDGENPFLAQICNSRQLLRSE